MFYLNLLKLNRNFLALMNKRLYCIKTNIIKSKSSIVIPNQLIDEYVWQNLDKWSDKTAVVCIESGKSFSYNEIYKKSKSLAYNLRKKLKLNKNETVAINLPNIPEFPIVFLGAIQAGLVVTTVSTVYNSEEIAKQLKDSNTRLIFTTISLLENVKKSLVFLKQNLPIILVKNTNNSQSDSINFDDLCHGNNEIKSDSNCEEVALLPYSSGTTGLPKGVLLTHRNVVSNLFQMSSKDFSVNFQTENNIQDVIPVFLPLFHIYGMVAIFLNFFSQGCKLVLFPKFGYKSFVKLLKCYRPTLIFAVPTIVRLLTNPKLKPELLHSIRTIISAAAPLGVSDMEKFNEKTNGKISLIQMYGTTETSPLILMQTNKLENGIKLGGSGFLLPNTQCRIIPITDNSDLNDLNVNERGELIVRGPQVMVGYQNNVEATKSVFFNGGDWLKTGDIGYFDNDQHFFICDRLKEIIKVQGFQVAPAELEEILRSHSAVEDCAVIGVPHLLHGEAPKAFVVLKQNSVIKPEQLMEFVALKVSPYKRLLGGVVFVDVIPKSPAGKTLRKCLLQEL